MDGGQIAGFVGVALFAGYNVYTGHTQGRVFTKRGTVRRDESEATFRALFGVYVVILLVGLGGVAYGAVSNLP